jgi:hypothetical protein
VKAQKFSSFFLFRTCSQILSPWLEYIADSSIGLSYRPASLCSLSGRYDNAMPQSAISPRRIWPLGIRIRPGFGYATMWYPCTSAYCTPWDEECRRGSDPWGREVWSLGCRPPSPRRTKCASGLQNKTRIRIFEKPVLRIRIRDPIRYFLDPWIRDGKNRIQDKPSNRVTSSGFSHKT